MAATLSPDAILRLKKVMQGQNPGGTTGEPATLGSPSDRGPNQPGAQTPVFPSSQMSSLAKLAKKKSNVG